MKLLAVAAVVALAGCTDDGKPGGGGACPLDPAIPDAGSLPALEAQRCNYPGSMGARKWFRLSATLPDTANVVQLELYDQSGPFAGGTVHTGTFPIETTFGTCGVCLRALGDKGGADQTEYFGTGGSITISAIGAGGSAISATVTNAALGEVDANHGAVDGGCSSTVAGVKIDGTVVDVGGTGGGGGGGGGGGMGACPTTVGD